MDPSHAGHTAATSTAQYDALFGLYFLIGAVVGVLVLSWLAVSLVRHRARAGDGDDLPGEDEDSRGRGLHVWIMVFGISGILFALAFGTLGTLHELEAVPADAHGVVVTGFQFGWIFDYDQGFRTFNELRVPVGEPVRIEVTSMDVFHNFAVPDYRIRIDAIPEKMNTLWFNATEPGAARVMCVELCGVAHAYMKATLVAVPVAEYDAWVLEQTGPSRGVSTAKGDPR